MKFLLDARLPPSLFSISKGSGMECDHVAQRLAQDDHDGAIAELSVSENLVLITKNVDFYDRYFQRRQPFKLLLITTGNIRNSELTDLTWRNLELIIDSLTMADVIQLSRHSLIKII